MNFRDKNYWALILGGSSGFGLASAKKLSRCGINICVLHRDRRGAMQRIEQEFEEIRSAGVQLLSFNLDALSADGRREVINALTEQVGQQRFRLLLHSIAFGSLKLMAPQPPTGQSAIAVLADRLACAPEDLQLAVHKCLQDGHSDLAGLAAPVQYGEILLDDGDLAETIYAMGTSLHSWTKAVFEARLFCPDARVIGLTSEGNQIAWLGYAAVSAAKAALEAVSRSIAREFAVYGLRSNIVQPGVTDTPALRMIPGSIKLMAHAQAKNPFGRLTRPEDVANVIALLCSDEAAWINGSIIRVDGGECVSG